MRKVYYWTPARIRELRKRLKLSQGNLGRELNVSNNTVNRWETGTSVPQPRMERALDRVAGIVRAGPALEFLAPRYDIKSRVLTVRFLHNGNERSIPIRNPSQSDLDETLAFPFKEGMRGEKPIPGFLDVYLAAAEGLA